MKGERGAWESLQLLLPVWEGEGLFLQLPPAQVTAAVGRTARCSGGADTGEQPHRVRAPRWVTLLWEHHTCAQLHLPSSSWSLYKHPSAGFCLVFFFFSWITRLNLVLNNWELLEGIKHLWHAYLLQLCICFVLTEEHRALKARVLSGGHVRSSIVSL